MALTGQIIYTIRNADGELLIFALVQTDNNYVQGAAPYILTPALFGLSQFAAKRAGAPGVNPFIAPRVLGMGIANPGNRNVVLDVDDSVAAGPALRAFYTSGGSGAPAPTNVTTTPGLQAGAVALTGSAAACPIVPGRAQECPPGSDLSGLNPVLMLAIGH